MTALDKLHQQYGARAKKNELPGIVMNVVKDRKRTNRLNIFLVADYAIG